MKEEFEKLWKVKLIKDLMKIDKKEGWKGTVTRGFLADNKRTIALIKYGFEEGVKSNEKRI